MRLLGGIIKARKYTPESIAPFLSVCLGLWRKAVLISVLSLGRNLLISIILFQTGIFSSAFTLSDGNSPTSKTPVSIYCVPSLSISSKLCIF